MNFKEYTRMFVVVASLILALTGILVIAPYVKATADNCNSGSCVYVRGSRLHVEYIRGGLTLGPRISVYGHIEIWGSGFHYNTADKIFTNLHRTNPTLIWERNIPINRNLPHNSKVCARFWSKTGGQYHARPIACVTVHR